MNNWTEKEIEAAKKLRQYLGFENAEDLLQEDIENDYLTINGGQDDNVYVWYCDESNNAIINVDTMEIISGDKEVNKIMNIAED